MRIPHQASQAIPIALTVVLGIGRATDLGVKLGAHLVQKLRDTALRLRRRPWRDAAMRVVHLDRRSLLFYPAQRREMVLFLGALGRGSEARSCCDGDCPRRADGGNGSRM